MKELRANTAVTIRFGPLLDATDGVTAETGLATAMDNASTGLRLSKDGGDYGDRNDSTAPVHDEIGEYDVDLDTTDTNTEGVLKIDFQNAACLPHWENFMVLSEAAYDAKYLPHPTAQAGSSGSITLASGEVTATNYLNGCLVRPVSGTGAGQAPRVITSSTITTDVCEVTPDWTTNPDSTTKYELIWLQQGVIEVDSNNRVDVGAVAGTAQTAGDLAALITTADSAIDAAQTDISTLLAALVPVDTTIATLASQTSFTLTAGSADDDAYNGWLAIVQDASTATQYAVGVVSDYTGSSKTVTLAAAPLATGYTVAASDKIRMLPPSVVHGINVNRVIGDGNATPWDGA